MRLGVTVNAAAKGARASREEKASLQDPRIADEESVVDQRPGPARRESAEDTIRTCALTTDEERELAEYPAESSFYDFHSSLIDFSADWEARDKRQED